MRTRVKICCIASLAEANAAIVAGADALGLVARMPSGPGTITDEQIVRITSRVPPPIATFMLTAETEAQAISEHLDATRPTTVQIVSHISPVESEKLARLQPVIRRVQVIHIEDRSALNLIADYAPFVHAFLLDSGRPGAVIPELGGTGRPHDWSISKEFVDASPLPVFLAGGLNAKNIREAIDTVRPFAVDLCSGVRSDGRLDIGKLKQFMAALP